MCGIEEHSMEFSIGVYLFHLDIVCKFIGFANCNKN
jgi:hypothetical protein